MTRGVADHEVDISVEERLGAVLDDPLGAARDGGALGYVGLDIPPDLLLAWQFGKTGVWVLASGLLRYAFVAAGSALPWLRAPLAPSQRRKAVAVLQVIALIVTVAPFVPAATAAGVAVAGLGALVLSFAVDIRWLYQRATPGERQRA